MKMSKRMLNKRCSILQRTETGKNTLGELQFSFSPIASDVPCACQDLSETTNPEARLSKVTKLKNFFMYIIPNVDIKTSAFKIEVAGSQYKIDAIEDMGGRGLYWNLTLSLDTTADA